MKTFIIFLSLIPSLALCQWNQNHKWKIQPLVIQPDRSYVWSFDSSEAFHYYSAEDNKNIVFEKEIKGTVCQDCVKSGWLPDGKYALTPRTPCATDFRDWFLTRTKAKRNFVEGK